MTLPLRPPIAISDTLSRIQPHPMMPATIFHSAEHYSEDENIFALLPPSPITADPRQGSDHPGLSQVGDSQQQGTRTTTFAANIASSSPTFDPIPTTAVSSNGVRVSLCLISENMDKTVLEDMQIKALLREGSSIK